MYEKFYNLRMLPFENTPDPRFWYASEQHREALAVIEYAIRLRKGFAVVTGEIGSGKTTVGRTMCDRLGDRAELVTMTHGHTQAASVLRQVLRALGVKSRTGDDHGQLLERLRDHLHDRLNRNRPIVMFVDEAQTYSDDALEELRLLSSFDTSTAKAVQIVLVGQPELRQRLRSPKLTALRQRIVVAKQLRPLDREDTAAYINHRLTVAAADTAAPGPAFDAGACNRVHQVSHGVPRLINVVSDNCLVLGMVRELRTITSAIVNQVAEDMIPSFEDVAGVEAAGDLRLAGNF